MSPDRDDGAAELAGASLAGDGSRAMRPPRVVVADDDDDVRVLLAAALRGEGCDVVEARDGAELLAWMESTAKSGDGSAADMILSDVRMPGLTGLQALRWLRLANCQAPAILMTAYGDTDVCAEAERLGAETVLEKPFDVREVVGAVLGRLSAQAWSRWSRWAVYAERAFGVGGDGTPG